MPAFKRILRLVLCADSAEGFPRSGEGSFEAGLSVGKGKVGGERGGAAEVMKWWRTAFNGSQPDATAHQVQ